MVQRTTREPTDLLENPLGLLLCEPDALNRLEQVVAGSSTHAGARDRPVRVGHMNVERGGGRHKGRRSAMGRRLKQGYLTTRV
jgi:hypothetical protein